jgi:hypothetical protein
MSMAAFSTVSALAREYTELPYVGGSSGEENIVGCDTVQQRYIVGLAFRYGNWIDAFGLICGKLNANAAPYSFQQDGPTTAALGGPGGGPVELRCGPEEVLAGWWIQRSPNNFVGFVKIRCRNINRLNDPAFFPNQMTAGRVSNKVAPASIIDCPSGELAYYVKSATGEFVDRLGLSCGAFDDPIASVGPPGPGIPEYKDPDATQDYGGINPNPPSPNQDGAAGTIPDDGFATALDRCKAPFEWRLARAEDHVCVPQDSRNRTANENAAASSLVDPQGAWGPASCISGYVWREAFDGDTVCVTPPVRDVVREENRLGPSRRAVGQ